MSIFAVFAYSVRPPEWSGPPPTPYIMAFSLEGLATGVDNVRFDVHLSPGWGAQAGKIAWLLLAGQTQAARILNIDVSGLAKEMGEFKRLSREVLRAAISQAIQRDEIRLDYLAQTAMVKTLLAEISGRFETLIEALNNFIWEHEVSHRQDLGEIIGLKEKVAAIRQNRKSILRNTSRELLQALAEVQSRDLKAAREAKFGAGVLLPEEFLTNPMLLVENPGDDLFMLEEYVLLGHRFADPDRYDALLQTLTDLLSRIVWQQGIQPAAVGPREIDGWLKRPDNFDLLLNCFQTGQGQRPLQTGPLPRPEGNRKMLAQQKKLLAFFYRKFKRAGLLKRLVAAYTLRSLYLDYYPALVPHQLLQFLTVRGTRRGLLRHLKRMKKFHGRSFSPAPLQNKLWGLRGMKTARKKEYLLRFLKDFSRYHRDLGNLDIFKEAMVRVNPATARNIIELSRANRTLHEFLLPHEQVLHLDESPVVHHVVIKADVRGATAITKKLQGLGLNPASYFSLNFFEPVTEILAEYQAEKIFIEGDAIIMAIFERQAAQEVYGVARACGLATSMLSIIGRYNAQNRKHRLPVLEIGIGISYQDTPPAYLFDGENRIMISPAINLADRLSSCTKAIRRLMAGDKKPPFNLYVFQAVSTEEAAVAVDDPFWRYNVNGIELNAAGFEKLGREIDLKTITCRLTELDDNPITIHTGKFPTVSGKYQRLVIREGLIPQIAPGDLRLVGPTPGKFYEVCTHSKLYDYVRDIR